MAANLPSLLGELVSDPCESPSLEIALLVDRGEAERDVLCGGLEQLGNAVLG